METGFFFAVVFPLVAFAAYLFELVVYRLDARPVVDRRESDGRARVVWRSYLATVTSGMAAGFALGCLVSVENTQSGAYVLAEVLVFARAFSCSWIRSNGAR